MLIPRPEVRQPSLVRFSSRIAIGRRRASARPLVTPGIKPLAGNQCASAVDRSNHAAHPVLQVSRLRRRRAIGTAGQAQQRFIRADTMRVDRTRHPGQRARPFSMNIVTVVAVVRRDAGTGLLQPSAAVVVGVALGHRIGAGPGRRQQVIQRIPGQGERGGAGAAARTVGRRPGRTRAFTELGQMPIGIMHRTTNQCAGVVCLADFAELMRQIIEVGYGATRIALRPPVAVDVVAGGFRCAVTGTGQAVKVVVAVGPVFGRAVDGFGVGRSSALTIEGVDMAGERCGAEEVFLVLQAAVFEPALRGAQTRVQAFLDQAAASIPDEADAFIVGCGQATEPADAVVSKAGAVAVAVDHPGQAATGGPGVAELFVGS